MLLWLQYWLYQNMAQSSRSKDNLFTIETQIKAKHWHITTQFDRRWGTLRWIIRKASASILIKDNEWIFYYIASLTGNGKSGTGILEWTYKTINGT